MIYGLVGEITSEVWRLQLEIFYEKKKKNIADGSDGEESHVGGFHALVRFSLLVLL